MNKNFEELYAQAVDILKDNDDLFMYCIDELDNWNGYADGFRAYYMDELNDFFCGMPATDLLDKLTADFNVRDNFFYFSIYGLESCDYKEDLYRDNVDEAELLDNLIEHYDDLDIEWKDADFDKLLQHIIEAKEGAA